jgi:hypothetical protein
VLPFQASVSDQPPAPLFQVKVDADDDVAVAAESPAAISRTRNLEVAGRFMDCGVI